MFKQSLCLIQKHSVSFTVDLIRCLSHSHRKPLVFTQAKPIGLLEKINPLCFTSRTFAKSRDIKKDKKKKMKIDENELQEYVDLEKLHSDLQKPLNIFKEELANYATLRSSVGAIENFKINYEGKVYSVQDLAEVGKKSSKLYVLDFSTFPNVIPVFLSTLRESEFNINAQQDGTRVYVPIPKVTKEHREVLAKKCKLYFSKCKEGIRDTQMKYIKKLGSSEKLSAEKKFWLTDQLTALGNKQILMAEEVLKVKHEELLKEEEAV